MQIHALPLSRPDETLYSVAARIRLANVARSDYDACRSLFGPSRNMRVSEFPVNLQHFCGVTQNSFGDPARVLQKMTLAAFFERLDSRPWHAGSGCAPIATAGYGLATLSNGSASRWRVCRRCVKEDLGCHATAFWRRAHHLPTGFLCPIHEMPLAACMAPPLERHRRFLLPEQAPEISVSPSMDWDANYQILTRLTALGIDVLEEDGQPMDGRTMRAALFDALGQRGLLTASGGLRRVQFAIEFTHRYHFLSRHPDFSPVLSSKGIDILQRNLSVPNAKRSAAHNLLLIEWLFGTWRAFQLHCVWQATMGLEASPASQADYNGIGHQHRKACLDFVGTYPSATRSHFARAVPSSLRWLLRYDEKWFNIHLPPAHSRRNQGTLF
jgi:hypothetical protein